MRLETERLLIRAFQPTDLETMQRILRQTFEDGVSQSERAAWLEWSRLNDEWFPKMYQTPYGDRAIELRSSGEVIGSVGLVPVHAPFDQIPELREAAMSGYYTTEVGLFWVIDPHHQGRGYATEAARALIEYAFDELHLKRIVAMTEYDNSASQRVMQKAGLTLTRNPQAEPPWLQVVGVVPQSTWRIHRK